MKYKSILLFAVLATIIAFFNFTSCHKYEGNDYSEWMPTTEADSVIYAKARKAYLDDPANKGTAEFKIMEFLSGNPYAVRKEAVENGTNHQFACMDEFIVTVYKGNGDDIGKVIKIEVGQYDTFIGPVKRDTIPEI